MGRPGLSRGDSLGSNRPGRNPLGRWPGWGCSIVSWNEMTGDPPDVLENVQSGQWTLAELRRGGGPGGAVLGRSAHGPAQARAAGRAPVHKRE